MGEEVVGQIKRESISENEGMGKGESTSIKSAIMSNGNVESES